MSTAMRIFAVFLLIAVVAGLHLASRHIAPDRRLERRLATAALLVIVLSLPLLHAPWIYMTVRCGRQPVAITDFAASNTYWLPSDPGYERLDIFRSYVCTEAEATANGYRRAGS
jgi:cytochrome bd-type quinol oxidase subunit 1